MFHEVAALSTIIDANEISLSQTINHNKGTHKKSVILIGLTPSYFIMVPMAGVEPARVSPHAPQACVSTNFTTSADQASFRDLWNVPAGILGIILSTRYHN